jgi:hypothetical protein
VQVGQAISRKGIEWQIEMIGVETCKMRREDGRLYHIMTPINVDNDKKDDKAEEIRKNALEM